ncbi:MAG: hypothetical protein OXK82_09760 [Deltaproteobacteria bacterium]|nr:hypothetical protein [Deltaproteobacteria bacterium]
MNSTIPTLKPRSGTPLGAFDAASEAARLKTQTRTIRRHRHGRSRLDRHAHELLALADAGCTTAELRRWLAERRVVVHHSTVARWLRRHGNG